MKRTMKCKHFNGICNDQCDNGVAYKSLRVSATIRYPCVIMCREPEDTVRAECPHCEYPTPEEIAAEEAQRKKNLDNMVKARNAITNHMRNKTGCGDIKCPICGIGTLSFSISACNGHIHAKCSTENCVCWME